jgi:hypothetical protein
MGNLLARPNKIEAATGLVWRHNFHRFYEQIRPMFTPDFPAPQEGGASSFTAPLARFQRRLAVST